MWQVTGAEMGCLRGTQKTLSVSRQPMLHVTSLKNRYSGFRPHLRPYFPEHIPEPRRDPGHHQEAEDRDVGPFLHHDPELVFSLGLVALHPGRRSCTRRRRYLPAGMTVTWTVARSPGLEARNRCRVDGRPPSLRRAHVDPDVCQGAADPGVGDGQVKREGVTAVDLVAVTLRVGSAWCMTPGAGGSGLPRTAGPLSLSAP